MKERNVTVTLEKAKEWFNSGNATLKEIALQAFREEELTWHYSQIKTLEDACKALGLNYDIISIVAKDVATFSKASAAMFKLNIIRKALNLGQDLYLTKCTKGSCLYYPYNPFVNENSIYYKDVVNLNIMEVIGRIKSEGKEYNVLGGEACNSGSTGLGNLICSSWVVHLKKLLSILESILACLLPKLSTQILLTLRYSMINCLKIN